MELFGRKDEVTTRRSQHHACRAARLMVSWMSSRLGRRVVHVTAALTGAAVCGTCRRGAAMGPPTQATGCQVGVVTVRSTLQRPVIRPSADQVAAVGVDGWLGVPAHCRPSPAFAMPRSVAPLLATRLAQRASAAPGMAGPASRFRIGAPSQSDPEHARMQPLDPCCA